MKLSTATQNVTTLHCKIRTSSQAFAAASEQFAKSTAMPASRKID